MCALIFTSQYLCFLKPFLHRIQIQELTNTTYIIIFYHLITEQIQHFLMWYDIIWNKLTNNPGKFYWFYQPFAKINHCTCPIYATQCLNHLSIFFFFLFHFRYIFYKQQKTFKIIFLIQRNNRKLQSKPVIITIYLPLDINSIISLFRTKKCFNIFHCCTS